MINVKNASGRDLKAILGLEEEIWPEGTRASEECFRSRLTIFPEGFFLAIKDRKIIAVSTSQIISYSDPEDLPSWEEATNNGTIQGTHDRAGNALYVVSVGSISRSGGGSALLQAQRALAINLGLDYMVLGSRIPGYDKYCRANGETPIDEYVSLKRKNGELFDPELRFYTRNGLSLREIKPGYMQDDRESRNYGAIMVADLNS